ncbi:hypothetical protein B0H10DRAFT_2380159 [Mycena sp. CBHHK59/15]|nr:hypothetical protein B0H10DRAFT_2380159 [Mycena sp. CBHHK59/15]
MSGSIMDFRRKTYDTDRGARPTRDNLSAPEAATKGSKQQGGAEESGPSKHQEQPYQALEMGDNPNTKIQRLRAQKMVSDAAYWVDKLHVYVCIVQLLLEDEDSIQAEMYYNHAMLLVHSMSDKETFLQFKLCQARINSSRLVAVMAVMEHNLLVSSKIYNNITFRGLGALLDLTPGAAETMARKMIEQGRLRGSIDQVDKLMWFKGSHEEDDVHGKAGGLGDVEEADDMGALLTKHWDMQIQLTAANPPTPSQVEHHLLFLHLQELKPLL